jgi:signal transduction histidine kinase
VTALSLAPYQSTEQYTLAGTAVLAVLLLSGAYLVLHAGVRPSVASVEEMTNPGSTLEYRGSSTADSGDDRRPTELANLALTLDALLDRLSAVLRNERALSAEISHELRTPLARALAEIQLLLRSSGNRPIQRRRWAISNSAAGDGRHPGNPDDRRPAAELQHAGTVRRGSGRARTRRAPGAAAPAVEGRDQRTAVAGVDAAVLERVLSPLLDNAIRFASARWTWRSLPCVAWFAHRRRRWTGDRRHRPPAHFERATKGNQPPDIRVAGLGLALA